MPSLLDPLVSRAPYFFMAVGLIWLAVAFLAGSSFVLWPVVACVAGGLLLRQVPSHRFTWAWVVATAVMGFLIAVYQVYAWLGFLGGAFSTAAAAPVIGFLVLAAVHVLLFYAAVSKPSLPEASSA